MPIDLRLDQAETALLIDLYHLTMAASFRQHGLNDTATFSLSVRRMPPGRGFLIAAGIERFIEALEESHFGPSAIDYLSSLKLFETGFLDYLAGLRFTGEVWAMPEGSLFFADEPILEVTGPLIEVQMFEALAINQVGLASLVATKAARCAVAAAGRRLIEFGLRRSHGADASLVAARSSYLAGFIGTSNMLAGRRYGIPVYGTMAHSFVMAHDSERQAFKDFASSFPGLTTLLVDTYDTVRGVQNAAAAADDLAGAGIKMQAIRLDSGDLAAQSRQARRILDHHGLNDVSIFGSGDLDEFAIADLIRSRAPIDAFGVGAQLVTSSDAPSLDLTYKLVEYKGVPRLKTSAGKASSSGRRQVFRAFDAAGGFSADMIGLFEEGPAAIAREMKHHVEGVRPLLSPQVHAGRRIMPRPTLAESRSYCTQGLAKFDARYKAVRKPDTFPVRASAALKAVQIGAKLRAESSQD